MKTPRRALLLVVCSCVVTTACGSKARSLSNDAYMERVKRIEGAVFDAIAAAGPAAWAQGTPRQRLGLELRQARVAEEASEKAVEELQALVPPEEYRRAHALLIEYYRVGSRFSAIEADVVGSKLRGRPDANAEEELRQVGERLMSIMEELGQTPPFLHEPLPVEV